MQLRVSFHTLGCKLNQLETESLADAFRKSGAVISPATAEADGETAPHGETRRACSSAADIWVINTCTVTSKAEQKARRLVRAALGAGRASVVLVTGCYAQLDREAIESLDERVVVVPGGEKASLLDLASWLGERWQGHGDLLGAVREWHLAARSGSGAGPFAFSPDYFAFHSRPALKIQDGCDNRCSYCRVCLARGPSRSLAASEVLRRVQVLEQAGRAEVVLTGVNLSQYRDGDLRFPGLVRFLVAGTERIAFRLSSYEPERIDEDFLEVFAHPRLRPHAHLPVQSGSDQVLARMARAYRRDKVIAAVGALRKAKNDPFVAADIIVGFPGETEADFRATLELAEACDFAWIHAFPFSPRPGTKAEALRPRVPERVAGERVEALAVLARKGRAAYAARWARASVEAVVEGSRDGACDEDEAAGEGTVSEPWRATSANYLKLAVEGLPESVGPGDSVICQIGETGPGEEALAADSRATFISRS